MDYLKANSLILNPDGVELRVGREAMKVNCSFFVPCINHEKAVKDLKIACQTTLTRRWRFDHEVRVEKGKLGVRFWRVI